MRDVLAPEYRLRYRNDAQFRSCVDAFVQMIETEGWGALDFHAAITTALYRAEERRLERCGDDPPFIQEIPSAVDGNGK